VLFFKKTFLKLHFPRWQFPNIVLLSFKVHGRFSSLLVINYVAFAFCLFGVFSGQAPTWHCQTESPVSYFSFPCLLLQHLQLCHHCHQQTLCQSAQVQPRALKPHPLISDKSADRFSFLLSFRSSRTCSHLILTRFNSERYVQFTLMNMFF